MQSLSGGGNFQSIRFSNESIRLELETAKSENDLFALNSQVSWDCQVFSTLS